MSITRLTDIKQNNKQRIFNHIYSSTDVTKKSLSETLRLSLPTINSIISELLENNLIYFGEKNSSTGGRKPQTICINSSVRFSIGVELSQNHIKIIVIDISSNELFSKRITVSFSDTAEYYKDLNDLISSIIDENELERKELLGVCITLPGVINESMDRIVFAPTLNLRERSISGIKELFEYPIHILNDANASAFAEHLIRKDVYSMAYIALNHGVGGSILINNETFLGVNHKSAEFGHICIHPHGKECACGKFGCLEAYCSSAVLSNELNITLDDFFENANRNIDYQIILREYLNNLAIGIINIHSILDCPIVLGGKASKYLSHYLDELKSIIKVYSPFEFSESELSTSTYADKSACIGAALHYVEDFIYNV